MKVQPPAESLHQELSRLSLALRVNVCVCVCESVCVYVCISYHVCGVCFHTRQEGKAPPLLVFHSTAFVIGQSQDFFNSTLEPFVLTCHDDQVDKRKHKMVRETLRVDCLVVFTRPVTA